MLPCSSIIAQPSSLCVRGELDANPKSSVSTNAIFPTIPFQASLLLLACDVDLAADVTGSVIPSPTLSAVITAVVHAYYIVQEQRIAGEECVARQSVYCDSDIDVFEVSARDESVAALASTAATFEVSYIWCTVSECNST